jgi:hypothetical protein
MSKDWLAFYFIVSLITFLGWAIMINYMLVFYPNQRTWWELLYDTMIHFDYDYELVEF